MKKVFFSMLMLSIIIFSNYTYASTMEFRSFLASELTTDEACTVTTELASSVYRLLGYNNRLSGNGYTSTNKKSTVLSYISELGNNFAFFVTAHGNTGLFSMDNSDSSQIIYTSDISGYWHLVFINSCLTLSNDSMARAFKTVGYDNRVTMGWYDEVNTYASCEWWTHFSECVGTTNLRSACLIAADQCLRYTPIRIFGDTTWDGHAL